MSFWALLQIVFTLVALYYSVKYLVVQFSAPLLEPLGIRIASIGLRSGITGLEYMRREPATTGVPTNTPLLRLASLAIGQAVLTLRLRQRKAQITLSNLTIRLVVLASSSPETTAATANSSSHSHPNSPRTDTTDSSFSTIKPAVDAMVSRLVRSLKNAGRVVRFVSWLGLLEIQVVGLDFCVVNAKGAHVASVRDEDASLSLCTDIISSSSKRESIPRDLVDTGNIFAVTVRVSSLALNTGIEILALDGETCLVMKVNMLTNTHSVSLELPHVDIPSIYELDRFLSKIKPAASVEKPATSHSFADVLHNEYLIRKDYYISLFRNAFLSTIHDFKPSILIHIEKVSVAIPCIPLDSFDQFDMEVPATHATWNQLSLSFALKSVLTKNERQNDERILWIEVNAAAQNLNVEVELRPGYFSGIASLPSFSAGLQISLPLFSLSQKTTGQINLFANFESLNVVFPSRLFLLISVISARKKASQTANEFLPMIDSEKRRATLEKLQFWAKLLLKYYSPLIDISLDGPVIGLRLGAYNGFSDSADAVLALVCENVKLISGNTLQLTPTRTSSISARTILPTNFKFLDLQLIMKPLRLESFTLDPYNSISFEEQIGQAEQKLIAVMSDSRSTITIWLTTTGVNVDIKSLFETFYANLTNMSSQQQQLQTKPPKSSNFNRNRSFNRSSSFGSATQPNTKSSSVDFFAVSTFIAGLLHKVSVIKSTFPSEPSMVLVPVVIVLEFKSSFVNLTCSENQSCAMSITAKSLTLNGTIDANLNQSFVFDSLDILVSAIAEFSVLSPFDDAKQDATEPVKEHILTAPSGKVIYVKTVVPADVTPLVELNFPNLNIKFNLWRFYVCLTSYLPILKMTKIINARNGGNSGVDVLVKIGVVNLDAGFDSGTRIEGKLNEISGSYTKNKIGTAKMRDVSLRTPHEKLGTMEEVLTVTGEIYVAFEKLSADKTVISVTASTATITNPAAFEFNNLFEDVINVQKGIKNLIFERMGLISKNKLSGMGRTEFTESEMPEYRVQVEKIIFRILDDEFESKLGRNYRVSFEEQFARIARYSAFQKRAMPMRDENIGVVEGPIEDAFWDLQEYNSRSWIKKISTLRNKEFPALLTATISEFSVVVTPPTLPCKYIEESINFIDPQTPIELEYDDLIARNVSLSISEICFQLRDFPIPFVHVPATDSVETWKTEGLLIIADLLVSAESKRSIDLSLSPLNLPPITVTRNLCPVKIYAQSQTDIKVNEKNPLFIAWGMCMEPPLADMIRVLDTFTKATVDPSPPVGWWDKTRHMIHLGKTVFNIGDGDMKVRILGSYTPYYDARYHYGMEGIDISFGKGVHVELCAGDSENLIVQCGQCTFSIPNSIHESGRISGAYRTEVKDDIFAQFVGGVRIAVEIRFTTYRDNHNMDEIDIWKSHSDVILKLPEYAEPAYGNIIDSYFGFRSKCIHVVYDIQSPFSLLKDESISNFVSFTNTSFSRFLALIPIYQSPLAIIPVRRGPLFEKNIVPTQKPKLGRSIKTNHLKGSMFPLILSYICEFEDTTGGVGLRFGAKSMDFDLIFDQINVKILKEGADAPSNTYRWVLQTANVEFTEVEGRTVSFGSEKFFFENKYRSGSGGGSSTRKNGEKLSHFNWFLNVDLNYVARHSAIDMIPFIWSPMVKYYKRSEDSRFESDHRNHTETEVRKDQNRLYQQRLDELDFEIRQNINLQKSLADKKEIFGYDSVQSEIDLITIRLELLFEKKNMIEKHIRNSFNHTNEYEQNHHIETELGEKNNESIFDHHYVMHNIRFQWKHDVRNICLRFFALIRRQSALSYSLSNAALKTVKELLHLTIKDAQAKKRRDSNIKANSRTNAPISAVNNNFDDTNVDEADQAQVDLLQQLLSDIDNLYVNHEGDEDQSRIGISQDSADSSSSSALANLISYTASSNPASLDYVAPNMCVNSSFIVQCINPQVNFEAANSSGKSTSSSALPPSHSVVIVAETMQFRSIDIMEATNLHSILSLDEDHQRQNEDLVKTRMILNVQNAQFFTCAFEDAQREGTMWYNNNNSNNGTNSTYHRNSIIADDPGGSSTRTSRTDRTPETAAATTSVASNFWPMWVPIENVTWNEFEVEPALQRVVGRTSAAVYRDKPNPLYVRRNSSTTKADFTDSYAVDFPEFRIEANSKQFFYVLDIVTNLLMYHDPTSGERSKRLRKMMLALDQMTDLTVVLDSVLILREKIQEGSKLLRFGKKLQDFNNNKYRLSQINKNNNQSFLQPNIKSALNGGPTIYIHHQRTGGGGGGGSADRMSEEESDRIRHQLLQFQEEMYVIVEALKARSILEQKKNSLEVALQVNIHAKNLVWTMMQPGAALSSSATSMFHPSPHSGEPYHLHNHQRQQSTTAVGLNKLAEWTITDSRFSWIQNEDQSSVNTLEIDRLHLENMMPHAAFRNLISPFGDTRGVNFGRNKMVRVYWREMAPVAGIKVVDHFEMNIYPLLLQISRETGRALEKYFFPKAAATNDEEDEAAPNSASGAGVATGGLGGSSGIGNNGGTGAGGVISSSTPVTTSVATAAITTMDKKTVVVTKLKKSKPVHFNDDFKEMQKRAAENRSFVYIKGLRERNFEDLNLFTFFMPTLEYRNKTWGWQDFFDHLKKDAIKAVLHNSGALVREKLLKKNNNSSNSRSVETAMAIEAGGGVGNLIPAAGATGISSNGSSGSMVVEVVGGDHHHGVDGDTNEVVGGVKKRGSIGSKLSLTAAASASASKKEKRDKKRDVTASRTTASVNEITEIAKSSARDCTPGSNNEGQTQTQQQEGFVRPPPPTTNTGIAIELVSKRLRNLTRRLAKLEGYAALGTSLREKDQQEALLRKPEVEGAVRELQDVVTALAAAEADEVRNEAEKTKLRTLTDELRAATATMEAEAVARARQQRVSQLVLCVASLDANFNTNANTNLNVNAIAIANANTGSVYSRTNSLPFHHVALSHADHAALLDMRALLLGPPLPQAPNPDGNTDDYSNDPAAVYRAFLLSADHVLQRYLDADKHPDGIFSHGVSYSRLNELVTAILNPPPRPKFRLSALPTVTTTDSADFNYLLYQQHDSSLLREQQQQQYQQHEHYQQQQQQQQQEYQQQQYYQHQQQQQQKKNQQYQQLHPQLPDPAALSASAEADSLKLDELSLQQQHHQFVLPSQIATATNNYSTKKPISFFAIE
ncbi:hypothetical protein HK100_011560 [Physocladia obscura]|uniref:Uncharacterized protein n=1 Tax=Physocladia obscura TaxID=109957 RepID=A0AAD5XHV3_9FUNG|nr:hypothetical protein HK100_011560 [Physocladia obscura]